jgi:hypothetical protein
MAVGVGVGTGLVILHGQSVMVKVWEAVAVYVLPLVVMVVATGQKVVKTWTVSVVRTTPPGEVVVPFHPLAWTAAASPKTERRA